MTSQQFALGVLVLLVILIIVAVVLGRIAGADIAPKPCTDASQCPSGSPYCVNGFCTQCRTAADCPAKAGYSCTSCLGTLCAYSNASPCPS
jgi:hypothetical protein